MVISSDVFLVDGPAKTRFFEQRKAKRGTTICRHLLSSPPEQRWCPRGKECHYSHTLACGQIFEFNHTYAQHVRRQYRLNRAQAIFLAITRQDTKDECLAGLFGTAVNDRPIDLQQAISALEARAEYTVRNRLRVLAFAFSVYTSDQQAQRELQEIQEMDDLFREHEPDESDDNVYLNFGRFDSDLSTVDSDDAMEEEASDATTSEATSLSSSETMDTDDEYDSDAESQVSEGERSRDCIGRLHGLIAEDDLQKLFGAFPDAGMDADDESDESDWLPALSEPNSGSGEATPLATPANVNVRAAYNIFATAFRLVEGTISTGSSNVEAAGAKHDSDDPAPSSPTPEARMGQSELNTTLPSSNLARTGDLHSRVDFADQATASDQETTSGSSMSDSASSAYSDEEDDEVEIDDDVEDGSSDNDSECHCDYLARFEAALQSGPKRDKALEIMFEQGLLSRQGQL
ncbi:hypothetical protein OIO90_006336 [Microbotryomycetes sp. JL221]|nr:hypothetical protein OIO90_006336 [Microbotryomycetes sp. JL221]